MMMFEIRDGTDGGDMPRHTGLKVGRTQRERECANKSHNENMITLRTPSRGIATFHTPVCDATGAHLARLSHEKDIEHSLYIHIHVM